MRLSIEDALESEPGGGGWPPRAGLSPLQLDDASWSGLDPWYILAVGDYHISELYIGLLCRTFVDCRECFDPLVFVPIK